MYKHGYSMLSSSSASSTAVNSGFASTIAGVASTKMPAMRLLISGSKIYIYSDFTFSFNLYLISSVIKLSQHVLPFIILKELDIFPYKGGPLGTIKMTQNFDLLHHVSAGKILNGL